MQDESLKMYVNGEQNIAILRKWSGFVRSTSIWGYLFTVTDFALRARVNAAGERNN